MELTSNQYRAVTHLQGPCMVLAGPGSGKTFIIVKRIEYLITKHKVRPEEILVVTFTKAAAKEMQERFSSLMGMRGSSVVFGTFHSVFLEILRRSNRSVKRNIITEMQKRTLIEQLLVERGISCDAGEIIEIIQVIGILKNQNKQTVDENVELSVNKKEFEEIFLAYEEEKSREEMLDFEDILIQAYQLLRDNPKLLESWQERFPYILIDEFQDINLLQYQTMKLLCEKSTNLFFVGDDDQSIYSFRGASPEIMLNFEQEYPNGVKIVLDKNFRSPTSIVRRSQKVIGNNEVRFMKQIIAQNKERSPIVLRKFQTTIDESYYILKEIEKLKQMGVEPHKIAILVRSQKDVLPTLDTLSEHNVPYFMREKHTTLYEHFIAKDILSYLRLATGERKRVDFLRIANRPNRYLRRDSLEDETISFEMLYKFYEDKTWIYPYLQDFEEDIAFLRTALPYMAVQYIAKKIGYADYLRTYAKERQISEESCLEVLEQLKMRAKKQETIEEWLTQIEESKQKQQEEMQRKQTQEVVEGKVQIMTIHTSKGLEYEAVFLIHANEGSMPHKQAVSKQEIEEERRVFYVAITRAKRKLYISYVQEKNGKQVAPSRFVGELIC